MEYKPPTALVVDDSPEFRALLSALLRQLGLTVHTAPDGEAGIAAAREHRPDLISLDLMLPVRCGLEVCEELRRLPETAEAAVLVVSARPFPQDRADAEAVGADGFVTKPVDPARFAELVRGVLWNRQQATVEV